jgi:acyl-CoA reductase-like NAD-dependent aldehyde dehydrogenase
MPTRPSTPRRSPTPAASTPGQQAMTVRQPLGVAGLISPPSTPAATVAWKVFPAVLCGNGVALKAPGDTPETALVFARLGDEAGLPAGIFNVVQGDGEEAEQPLVEHEDVAVVGFTGSTAVGRMIARVTGERLAKVCLELGGKNPLRGAARASAGA